MGQNMAVQAFRNSDGNLTFPQLDENGSLPVALASEGIGDLPVAVAGNPNYEAVAASQTKQPLGTTGAVGDVLSSLLIIPGTTSPGAVTLYDGSASTGIVIFAGGATSVAGLAPIPVPLNIVAATVATPGWFVTTGANVTVLAAGNFT